MQLSIIVWSQSVEMPDASPVSYTHLELETALFVSSAGMVLKLGIASVALTGSVLLVQGSIDVLTLFLFLMAASRMYDPMQGALQNLAAVIAMRTNVGRMNEILDAPLQTGSEKLTNQGCDIVFDHVGFAYNLSLIHIYGCSLGGACLTRFLALGKIPVERAVIDAGITPYRMPLILRRLACLRDNLGFRLIAKSRKVLETVYPPEMCIRDSNRWVGIEKQKSNDDHYFN